MARTNSQAVASHGNDLEQQQEIGSATSLDIGIAESRSLDEGEQRSKSTRTEETLASSDLEQQQQNESDHEDINFSASGDVENGQGNLDVENGASVTGFTSDHHTRDGVSPPPSCGENFRDALLRFLDRPEFQYMGIAVNILIVADGAFFFFLLMGWQAMCSDPSRTDCDPRNWWYNWSVQVLTGLFSYMALQSMPWRSTQFLHIAGWSCPFRTHEIGKDLYGLPTDEVWYHIVRWKRLGMISLLIMNCLTQFVNQGTRIVFSDYDSQNQPPGSIWTNVFFFGSMAFAAVAALWQVYEEHQIRKRHPDRFAPGPIALLQGYYRDYGCKCCWSICCWFECCCCEETKDDDHEEDEEVVRPTDANTRYNFGMPTFPELPFDRTDLRLWGM